MKPPLYVDLDGTLIRSDTMQQAYVLLLRDHPIDALRALYVELTKGRHDAKEVIAEVVEIDPATLPYREAVVDYVKAARAEGRRVVLATGSHRKYADAVAKYLGIFDAVFATEKLVNLIGPQKLATIRKDCDEKDFEYLGDSEADIVIFEASARAGMVGGRRYKALANNKVEVHRLAHIHNNAPRDMLRLLRPHQWVKNVLVALPAIAGHKLLTDWHAAWTTLAAFIAFCLIASASYVLNDLFDIDSDRRHASKRARPLATGAVTIPRALVMIAGLLVAGFVVAACVGWKLAMVMLAYLVLTNLYSFNLKRRLLVDVVALATMYTLRPIAGGAAAGIPPSAWLLAFCMFFFACIAFAKRYTELGQQVTLAPKDNLPGRGYQPQDLEILRVVGPVNGYLAVFVVALYINSPSVNSLYAHPQFLWLICPILAYWVTRLWFFAHRGALHHDPVVFALTDWKSYLAIALTLAAAVAATIH